LEKFLPFLPKNNKGNLKREKGFKNKEFFLEKFKGKVPLPEE